MTRIQKQIEIVVAEVLRNRPKFTGSIQLNVKEGVFINTNVTYRKKAPEVKLTDAERLDDVM